MKKILAATLTFAFASQPVLADGFINRIPLERIIPAPPARGSATEQAEVAEILKAQAAATPAQRAQARWDNDHEDWTIFQSVLGPKWDLAKLPKTKFLIERIMDVDRADSSESKKFFKRARPWIVNPQIKTCAEHETGPAETSYPSGHTMLGFELGVVMASLMPNNAKTILARAQQYGESRIICGFHFRSDLTAGQQFGTVLAIEMMMHPTFRGWFNDSRAELIKAGLTK
jgi:acid phosphatase (class A)